MEGIALGLAFVYGVLPLDRPSFGRRKTDRIISFAIVMIIVSGWDYLLIRIIGDGFMDRIRGNCPRQTPVHYRRSRGGIGLSGVSSCCHSLWGFDEHPSGGVFFLALVISFVSYGILKFYFRGKPGHFLEYWR